MLCQNCFKNNAIITVFRIINKDHKKLNLCKPCMKNLGFDKSVSNLPQIFTGIVVDILKFKKKESRFTVQHSESGHCPDCGCLWSEFESCGLIGCGNCYITFLKQLKEILERIQGTAGYTGKRPKIADKIDLKKKLLFLERALLEAVNKEEYEKAAEFRDKILAIKK